MSEHQITYSDVVVILPNDRRGDLVGKIGHIIGIFQNANGLTYREFDAGRIMCLELEDGSVVDIEEMYIEKRC